MNALARRGQASHNACDDPLWCHTHARPLESELLSPVFTLHISVPLDEGAPTLSCSVGNGPPPTRVVYALITPITFPMRRGGIPRPVQIPPTVVELLVTYGYVP